MTLEEKIVYWVEISDKDLKVAEDLYTLKHYLYSGFMCHQSIEKIFKGYYTKLKEDEVPRVHDLQYLAAQGGYFEELSEEQKQFIRILNPLNIRARYPEYKDKIYKQLTNEICADIVNKTKELQRWIKERL